MTIEKVSFIDLSFNLNKNKWSEILFPIGNNLRFKSFNSSSFNPFLNMNGSLFEFGPSYCVPLFL